MTSSSRATPDRRSPRDSPFLPPSPPSPEIPVGARLQAFAEAWGQITTDQWVLQIISQGYAIPFVCKPPLSTTPISLVSRHPQLQQAIQALLDKRAVERVSNLNSPGFYSRLFLVPKKNGQWRPVIDLSALNSFVERQPFKMETLASIKASIQPGHWGISMDLSDAYFHVPIHPSSRKFLRFCFKDQVFQFRALPFGLATAPRVFTKIMAVVGAHLRLRGSILLQYFDDWLLHQAQRRRLLMDLRTSWSDILSLGLLLNPAKSELVPSQNFMFVGINFLTADNVVRVPLPRVQSILNLLTTVMAQSRLSARAFLSLLGVLNAAADLVYLGRLHLRPIQFYLLALWHPHSGQLTDWIPIRPVLLPLLRWWTYPTRYDIGVPLTPPSPSLQLVTDASQSGWGAHLEPLGLMVSGVWTLEERCLHINNLEMRAARLAISHFRRQVEGHCVLLSSDNTTVVSYVNRQGGTHSLSLFHETKLLFYMCRDFQVILLSRHIPGRLNVLADSLSRSHQLLPSEWSLHRQVVAQIFHLLGRPMVDLFATRFNHQLPLYVSPVMDPRAMALDAMSFSWDALDAYAFPPFCLLPQILRKIRSSQCRVLLIAPWWPQRAWFSDLLELLRDLPRSLPIRPDLLLQRGCHHTNPGLFQLHVWPLSGRLSERNAFLLGRPRSSPQLVGNPPGLSTMPSGRCSRIGVTAGRLIRSIPLQGE